jgi:hypothetical protein
MGRRSLSERLRTAGLLLALFALTFKAMLPPGYMLSTDADNRVVVSLCMGGEMLLDLGGDGQSPSQDASSAHCPFAFTAAPVVVPPVAAEIAPTFAMLLAEAAPIEGERGDHDATGPPLPARGPPLNV